MKTTGIIRRVDNLGRIAIPKEIRKQVFGKTDVTDEPMEIFIDGENIVLQRYEEVQTCKWIKYDYRTICPKITMMQIIHIGEYLRTWIN